MCVGTASKLYQVIIPLLREWMLDARGRVLGSSLREIRCGVNWRESSSMVKVTKVDQRNWEKLGRIHSEWKAFRRSRVSPLATTSSIAWLEPLALWQTTSFARSTILCYKEFSSTSSPLFIAWIPNLWAVRPHGRFFTRFRSRICWIRKF